jgi:hypothetical protein
MGSEIASLITLKKKEHSLGDEPTCMAIAAVFSDVFLLLNTLFVDMFG